MDKKTIYLDYNATTPVDPEVAAAMQPYLFGHFGNPSSSHQYGFEARKAVESAREKIALLLNCNHDEIVFTSGGTESNNYAIKGIAYALRDKGNHIITSAIEHPAVLNVCSYLEKYGYAVTYVPVDTFGIIDLERLEKSIRKGTILITIMHANNETGTIQPVEQIAELARSRKIFFHTDAAQTTGKISVDVQKLRVDLLSLAGHKLYGPKGIGALYIRSGIDLEKLIHGADHEQNRRAGTENVMEIVGLGKACEIARRDADTYYDQMKTTRDHLYDIIQSNLPEVVRIGDPDRCLPNTLSVGFPGIEADQLLSSMPEIAASAGAACHADKQTVSHVLQSMQVHPDIAMGTVRFSTGKYTTFEDIENAAGMIVENASRIMLDKTTITKARQETGVKLTHYSHGLGCACKISPDDLEQILAGLPLTENKDILVDARNADDAAVYKISEDIAIIQTVDFFTPVVDDAYDFGAIAAANALSDIYAMGGKPLFALNIVGFPVNRLPLSILETILEGAKAVAAEAEINILGGHTIEDIEPKFGMAVTGVAHPDKILTNSNARQGDALILTKPIGTGIISAGIKRGQASETIIRKATELMKQLNKTAAQIASFYPVNACTDITGFGLLGHLYEMLKASHKSAEIFYDQVPIMNGTNDLTRLGLLPGGTKKNMEFYKKWLQFKEGFPENQKYILSDAQTSGGLLFSVPEKESEKFLHHLRDAGVENAAIIGHILDDKSVKITIH
ncbi:MAG: selenide, water dikinase [Bacteroides sp. SM23_62_1]|nr:MAG: selenide, water dikinase [Bacteroides sp. SM23_62_1]